ncbi:MAG: (d)CMP kinase, partial [Collinsella bouchesdurhonensis]|nr:(d)CMP kinase [Collinsella bouchesdurhonensis]
MIIAIDGPAGSGKSTIANLIADRLKFDKLDTGAMYRTVAFVCASSGIDLDDEKAVTARANDLTITFDTIDGMQHVFADGKDVSREIRTPETDRIVSKVSAYPDVRKALLRCQRHFAATRNVVAEGRDIGTVVFPQAEVKVFLT